MKIVIIILSTILLFTSCGKKEEQSSKNDKTSGSDKKSKLVSSGPIAKIDKSGPFLVFKPSIAQIRSFIEKENPPVTKEAQYQMAVSAIDSLKVTDASIFLESGQFPIPSVLLTSAEDWKDLDKNALFGPFLKKESDSLYKFKENSMEEKMTKILGQPVIKIQGKKALFTFTKSKYTVDQLLKSSVFNKAQDMSASEELFAAACLIPDKIDINITKMLEGTPAKGIPVSDQIAGTVDKLLGSLGTSLESVDYMALSFNIKGEAVSLSFKQQFRDDKTGLRTYNVLEGKDSTMGFDLVSDFGASIKSDKINKNFNYKNGILHSQLKWNQKDTNTVMRGISRLVMRSMMSGSDSDPAATKGTIKVEYGNPPVMSKNASALKKKIPQLIKQAAFPSKMFPNSDRCNVHFEEIPGFGFGMSNGPLEYTMVECKDKQGKSIPLKKEDSKFKQHLNNFIFINFKEKLPKTTVPASAKLKVKTDFKPVENILEFNKSEKGKVKNGNGVVVRLDYIDRDAVKVSHKGTREIKIYAYDKNNRVLKRKHVNGIIHRDKANYMGEVEKIKVVTYGEPQKIEVDVTLDLTPVELPEKPAVIERRRKGYPTRLIDDFLPEDFTGIKVTKSDPKQKWQQNLQVKLNKSPGVTGNWSIIGIKDGTFEKTSQQSITSDNKLFCHIDKKIKDCKSFLGILEMKAKTGVKTHTVSLKDGAKKTIKLSDGAEINVKIDKNHLSITKEKNTKLLNISAYDEKGILKNEGSHTNVTGKNVTHTYKYWGNIKKVQFQSYVREIEHVLKFELIEEADAATAKKAWVSLEKHFAVLKTLSEIVEARKKTNLNFGENIAYLHFSFNEIPKEVAESDPLGTEMFGYTAKPFKGYTYSLAKGKIDYNGKEVPFKVKYARKGKMLIKGKETEVTLFGSLWNLPWITAVPEDPAMPTYYVLNNYICWKTLNEKIEYYPANINKWQYKNIK